MRGLLKDVSSYYKLKLFYKLKNETQFTTIDSRWK